MPFNLKQSNLKQYKHLPVIKAYLKEDYEKVITLLGTDTSCDYHDLLLHDSAKKGILYVVKAVLAFHYNKLNPYNIQKAAELGFTNDNAELHLFLLKTIPSCVRNKRIVKKVIEKSKASTYSIEPILYLLSSKSPLIMSHLDEYSFYREGVFDVAMKLEVFKNTYSESDHRSFMNLVKAGNLDALYPVEQELCVKGDLTVDFCTKATTEALNNGHIKMGSHLWKKNKEKNISVAYLVDKVSMSGVILSFDFFMEQYSDKDRFIIKLNEKIDYSEHGYKEGGMYLSHVKPYLNTLSEDSLKSTIETLEFFEKYDYLLTLEAEGHDLNFIEELNLWNVEKCDFYVGVKKTLPKMTEQGHLASVIVKMLLKSILKSDAEMTPMHYMKDCVEWHKPIALTLMAEE